VAPDLTVNVFAPSRAPASWIEDAVQGRGEWIVRTLEKVAACELLSLPELFLPGDTIWFLGRKFRLAVVEGKSSSAEILFDALVLTVSDPGDERAIGRDVKRWYRDRAAEQFERSIQKCLLSAAHFGITKPILTIRNMRSRWGSCSSNGRVRLNLKLVMVPEACIDYVVMHELCHLVHHNHSKRYYALLTKCMPDWKERKKVLDGYRMR
jgi:hypothetical protein